MTPKVWSPVLSPTMTGFVFLFRHVIFMQHNLHKNHSFSENQSVSCSCLTRAVIFGVVKMDSCSHITNSREVTRGSLVTFCSWDSHFLLSFSREQQALQPCGSALRSWGHVSGVWGWLQQPPRGAAWLIELADLWRGEQLLGMRAYLQECVCVCACVWEPVSLHVCYSMSASV